MGYLRFPVLESRGVVYNYDMAKLTFLGTGTSTGVPVVGCDCPVCASADPKDNRTRSSAWIENDGHSVIIDTATDFRFQALREKIKKVDAVLFTHHHADHVHGIDDLRTFNFFQKKSIPCFGSEATLGRISEMFAYIFDGSPETGGGKPKLDMVVIDGPVEIGEMTFTPISVMHGALPVYGYKINNTAYVTDCSLIPPETWGALENLDTLILGALGLKKHTTHFTMEEALSVIEQLKPKRAYLTHLTHHIGHAETTATLPEPVNLAYDGLSIDI